MDEVDRIIIHSLREIGCPIDSETMSIANFTPELIVRATSACLQQISITSNPNRPLPKSLPAGMAQRFAVATTLAEECTAYGYRSDIGYQSFLYPNTVDVRRLFMFLIEQLPKETPSAASDTFSKSSIGPYEVLQQNIKDKIRKQLSTPWVPQYCRVHANRQRESCSSLHLHFEPQLNLNIPSNNENLPREAMSYLQQQAPNVFQQTAAKDYDLISSVLHKNALMLDSREHVTTSTNAFKYSPLIQIAGSQSIKPIAEATNISEQADRNSEENSKAQNFSTFDKLNETITELKSQHDSLLAERKNISKEIASLKHEKVNTRKTNERLRGDTKVHERACVVLENPEENVEKLEGLVQSTMERRETLERQWQTYRKPLEESLKNLQMSKQAMNAQNVADLREVIDQLEQTLRDKTAIHTKLIVKLKSAEISAAPRKEYTRRILEFIGNIRKQRNDIFKVLDDTRDLQKQLNSVTAQLQRQFNYTDDLLFQSAKHDMHAKKAYKLLASLHATCNDLVELVSQTGNISKEIRELEVQIDREQSKNVAISLEQISSDIRNFENLIQNIQLEIQKAENNLQS